MQVVNWCKGIAAAGFVLTGSLFSGCNQQTAPPPGGPAEVAIVTIHPEQITLTTELPGRTTAYLIAEIRPQVSGLLQKRMFAEGASVQAGDLLY